MRTKTIAFALLAVAVLGCDAGKKPYEMAAAAEQRHELRAAMEGYDSVCITAPNSALCAPAKERADVVRGQLADDDIAALRFSAAKALLKDSHSLHGQLTSTEMIAGLAFEAAGADRQAALVAVEKLASTDGKSVPAAKEWLKKERPGILWTSIQAKCAALDTTCAPLVARLRELHPDAPEATKAAAALATYEKRRKAMFAAWLETAEKNMADCASVSKRESTWQTCNRQGFLATDDPLRAMAIAERLCGQNPVEQQKKELSSEWDLVTKGLREFPGLKALEQRHDSACSDGDYVPSIVEPVPLDADTASAAKPVELAEAKTAVDSWNEAHNRPFVTTNLERMYASKLKFYGQNLDRSQAIVALRKQLAKSPGFHQEVARDLERKVNERGQTLILFDKTYGSKEGPSGKVRAYLLFERAADGELQIIHESDTTTDSNLKALGF